MHVTRVAAWLEALGLGEADLRCGPQVPEDAAERHRLRDEERRPGQLHNNCSGKHAGFLMLNQRLGGGAEYVELDHPVQRAVRAAFEEMCGAAAPGWGIDGCSAPNFATTVHGLALAMARMADPRGLGRGARGGGAAAGRGDARASAAGRRRGPRLLGADGGDGRRGRGQDRRRGGLCRDPAGAGPRGGAEDRGRRHPRLRERDRRHPGPARRPRRPRPRGRASPRPAALSRRGAVAGAIRPAPELWAGGDPL